ncbi:MAG TPA: hypothetical protein DCW90_15125, partial [Lachnospiraceae bacterium]|nr:hypothetical protein [Lachnospiraceae bacterium]
MKLFGDVLFSNSEDEDIPFSKLKRLLEMPYLKPRYRLSVLTQDEQVAYIIPEEDIIAGSINYTESYQSGQRRNISLELVNASGKYTPNVNGLWVNSRFSFEIGIEYAGRIIWFPKGIYIMGNLDLTRSNSEKTVCLQLLDKYAIFEGKTGTLEVAYEVELGSDIRDAIRGILNFSLENGYILDYKDVIFDPSLVGMVTQQTIRAEQGENYGSVIDALATQLSAEYYYNSVGNLCFYPINETVNDDLKPIIWTFANFNRDLHNLNLTYKNEDVVNCIKVVGDNVENGVCSAVVTNDNPSSPICIQQIGKRTAPTYSEANVWNDELAHDLANYYLRKASFVAVDFSCDVSFNPVLTVNNICEVENDHLNFKREKLLITNINYTSDTGLMNISFCNTMDL